jgi:hypothetical protein
MRLGRKTSLTNLVIILNLLGRTEEKQNNLQSGSWTPGSDLKRGHPE